MSVKRTLRRACVPQGLIIAVAIAAVPLQAQASPVHPSGPQPEFVYGCTVSATAMSFGNYDVFAAAPSDATSTVTTSCNSFLGASTVTITFSTGQSGSFFPRNLVSGTNILDYNLYKTAAYAQVLGNGNNGTVSTTFSPGCPGFFGTCIPYSVTLYGRIPAQQNVVPGSYSDTITVTATF